MKVRHSIVALLSTAGLLLGCSTSAPERAASAPAAPPAAPPSVPSAARAEPTTAPPADRCPRRHARQSAGGRHLDVVHTDALPLCRRERLLPRGGVEIERETIPSSDQMIAPLATDQLEVGASGFGAGLFNAALPQHPLQDRRRQRPVGRHVVGRARRPQGAARRRPTPRLRRPTGLKVAMAGRGTGLHITLDRALQKGGLTLDDVEIVDLRFPDMTPALANGAVDAALHVEPGVALGVEQGVFGVFKWMDEIYPDQQFNAVLYAPQFAANTDPPAVHGRLHAGRPRLQRGRPQGPQPRRVRRHRREGTCPSKT